MNTLFCSPRGVLMSNYFDACTFAAQSIGSQPFATFCSFVLAAALYCSKTLGTRMILTVEW